MIQAPEAVATVDVEYRTLVRFPGYRFGSDGSVWTCWKKTFIAATGCRKIMTDQWRPLKPGRSNGYLIIRLCERGKPAGGTIGLHSLICEAFHGPCPPGMECRHFPDGCRSNNSSSNLRWGTRSENHHDMWQQGTKLYGELSPNTKLKEADVIAIRNARTQGETLSSLARKYGVGRTTIDRIVKGKTWASRPISATS